jgi:hypothetical protein
MGPLGLMVKNILPKGKNVNITIWNLGFPDNANLNGLSAKTKTRFNTENTNRRSLG